MKNTIQYYILAFLCCFVSIKITSQGMVALPNGGCGRLLATNTSSRSDGGFLCFRLGKEAINPTSMTDTDVNSFGSLKPGTGAGLFCNMFIGVGTNGTAFKANKPVYIDFASDGFNFNPSFNGGNFVFYKSGQEVYRTGVNGHFFFDFGDDQQRRIIKVIPTADWDEVRLAFAEVIGVGFSFSQMRVYNILSEYYIAPMTFSTQTTDKTVSVGGSTTMAAVIANTDTDETPDNITYQWQILNGGTWTNLSNNGNYNNVTTSTLAINNVPANFNNNQYRVIANSSFHTCSFQATSNVGKLFVNSLNDPGSIAADQKLCLDVNNDPAAFTQVLPAQGTGTLEFKWQSSTDNVTFVDIANAVSATYDAPPITQTTYYRRAVRSVLNGNSTNYQLSNVVTVTTKTKCNFKCIISNKMIYTKLK